MGRVRRSYLGIRIGRLDPEAPAALVQAGGVPVATVAPGGPAATAGLQPGDIIYRIAGKPVGGTGALQATIEAAPPGEPLTLSVSRNGQEIELTVRPEAQPDAGPGTRRRPRCRARPAAPTGAAPRRAAPGGTRPEGGGRAGRADRATRGPQPRPASPTWASAWPSRPRPRPAASGSTRPPGGLVVIGIEPDGPADRAGVELGMIITDAAERKVATLPEFRAALAQRRPGTDLVLRVLRGGRPGFRVLLGQPGPREPMPPDGPLLEPIAPEPPR